MRMGSGTFTLMGAYSLPSILSDQDNLNFNQQNYSYNGNIFNLQQFSDMQNLRNIIVTGSNKGIGFGVVENLAAKQGWNIIMACRSVERADEAKKQLLARFPNASLQTEQLDVSDSASIDAFINVVKDKYKKIDVVINNAGVAAKGDAFDSEVVKFTFATNYFGTVEFAEKILSSVSESGKVIFVGSMVGKYTRLSEELKLKFRNPEITKQELNNLLQHFIEGVANNDYQERGFPKTIYGMSKVGINTFARVFANYEKVKANKIQVYAMCPGYVDTDMTSHKGILTIQQGALTPVYLAELPFEVNPDLQGKFFEKSGLSSLE